MNDVERTDATHVNFGEYSPRDDHSFGDQGPPVMLSVRIILDRSQIDIIAQAVADRVLASHQECLGR
jgi:hypothetical protein